MTSISDQGYQADARPKAKVPFYRVLYVQVLIAIVLGIVLGIAFPKLATEEWVKALGDGFVRLIKMVIAPIIFCTVVSGVAHVGDARKVGRVAVKALVYFEVVSTFALAIGLVLGNIVRPGHGFGAHGNADSVAKYAKEAGTHSATEFFLNIIPDNVFGAFATGNIIQVLLFAILFGFALMASGERGRAITRVIDEATHALFGVIAIVMKAAPLGAFGALAYTVGKYGAGSLGSLLGLIATFYTAAFLFVVLVLGAVAAIAGFNIFKFLSFIKAELLVAVGTGSSESALPQTMERLEHLGCSKSVVGLVMPTGYSFNLDGTNIYMTLSTLFIAQALGVPLDLTQQLTILGVAMLTSKGATGVSGAGFITLAATLSAISPALVPGMAIILGIDKFMSECRGLTNLIGNAVACVVVSAWENELDRGKLRAALNRSEDTADASAPAVSGWPLAVDDALQ